MSRPIQREGTFKGRAVSWVLRKTPKGAYKIVVEFLADAIRNGETWSAGPAAKVFGDFFPLKATGAPNEKVAAMLCETLGWGGTFAELLESPPLDAVVQFDVEGREYNGKTYYSVKWVRQEGDDGRRQEEEIDATTVVNLDKKHAADLKAIASKHRKEPQGGTDGIPF